MFYLGVGRPKKALDRLTTGLSAILRTCLISDIIELFDSWRERLPDELATFLKDFQECYAYKYRVAAYKTVLSSDGYSWNTLNVQRFHKNNSLWYGISIVRNDGEHVYFEGSERSINHMIGTIQSVTGKKEGMKSEEV